MTNLKIKEIRNKMKIKDEFGNLQEVQTISTNTIEAIISRNEMRCAIYQNTIDKENLVLISIGEPGREDTHIVF